jgi:hypothetical protein
MYKVTIVKIEDVNYVSKEWRCKWSDDVFKSSILNGKNKNDEDAPSQYGYAETSASKEQETELFQQTVIDLDIPSVIKAINSL